MPLNPAVARGWKPVVVPEARTIADGIAVKSQER
jgi:hypothetical protein